MRHSEYFASVEHIWLLWLSGLVLLAVLTCRALRGCRWSACQNFLLAEEEGAAYSLAYVMTFPIYLALVCGVIETSLILVVKIGTVYAAYASARSAVVWSSAEPANQRQTRAERAMVHALTPFASSNSLHASRAGVGGQMPAGAREYAEAYRKYARKSQDGSFLALFKPGADWNSGGGGSLEQYLIAKYRFAKRSGRLRLDPPGTPAWNADITATVTYDYPFNILGVGRLLREP
ncbi:MAG: hypothetical protein JNM56_32015, partial [Planctomycetia bacterium]|nr:hypothetical protein [Planctomycetia bacterium]